MGKKLIEEYLNKHSKITNEKVVVLKYTDFGVFIKVLVEWENKITLNSEYSLNKEYLEIPLFDLLIYVYSKK